MKNLSVSPLVSFFRLSAFLAVVLCSISAHAQFGIHKKVFTTVLKAATSIAINDEIMAGYLQQSLGEMDAKNNLLPEDNPYTQRLRRITQGISQADNIPLNFQVYEVDDINAFACPDGSVRIYSPLMDIMDDDELMGIIGHEIGHIVKRHTKNTFKMQILSDAFKEAVATAGDKVAQLTESQLSVLGTTLMNAQFSQKQEYEADECGYDFLVSHGKNPWDMISAFEKLDSIAVESPVRYSYIRRMFSSHSETLRRIERISSRCKADGYVRPQSCETRNQTDQSQDE